MNFPRMAYPQRDAAYYQRLHEQEPSYQTNNWLLDEIEEILAFGASSVLELASGNGRFLEVAAPLFNHVHGCDWAVSPRIEGVLAAHPNTTFFRVDLYQDLPPCPAELVVSADFLEHLAPEALPTVLRRIDSLSLKAFHKIACYDDGHSHLSILSPPQWLALFHSINPLYNLERREWRMGDTGREIAVLSKGRIVPRSTSMDQTSANRDSSGLRAVSNTDTVCREESELRKSFHDLFFDILSQDYRDVVICGAGRAGHLAAAEARTLGLNLLAMSDRNHNLHGMSIEGAPIMSLDEAIKLTHVFVIGSTVYQEQIRSEIVTAAKRWGTYTPIIFSIIPKQ